MKISKKKNYTNLKWILLVFVLSSKVAFAGTFGGLCSSAFNKVVEIVKFKRLLDEPYQKLLSTIPSDKIAMDTNSELFLKYRSGFTDTLSLQKVWSKMGIEENKEIGTIFDNIVSDLTDQVIVAIQKVDNKTVRVIKGKVLFVKSPDMKVFNVSILTDKGLVKVAKKDLYNIHALKEEKWIEKHAKITKTQRLVFTLSEFYNEGMDHKFKFFFKVRDPSETPKLISSDSKFLNYLGQSGYVSKANYEDSFLYWLKHPVYFTFMLPQKLYWESFNRSVELIGKESLKKNADEYYVPTLFNGIMESVWRRRVDDLVRISGMVINYSDKTKKVLAMGPVTATMPLALVTGIASFGVAYKTFDKIYDEDVLEAKLGTIHGISEKYLKMLFMDPLFLRVRQKYLPGYEVYDESLLKTLSESTQKAIAEEVYVRLTATDDYYYGLVSDSREDLVKDTLKELRKKNLDYKNLKSEEEKKSMEEFIVKLVTAHSFLQDMSASVLFPATKELAYEKGPSSTKPTEVHGLEVPKEQEGAIATDDQLIKLMDINNKQLHIRWLLLEMGGATTANLPIMLTTKPELLKYFNELLEDEYISFLIKKGKVEKQLSLMRLTYLLLEYASWKEKFSRWEVFGTKRYEKMGNEKLYLSINDFIEERKKSLKSDNTRMRLLNTVDFFDTLNFDNTYLARTPKKDILGYQAGRLIGPIGRQVLKFRQIINFATRNRMKAGVRGAGSQKVTAARDLKTKKLKVVAVANTFFGEVMNKLGTVLVGFDLWSRCDGKQDVLDLEKTTGQNPFISQRDNSFSGGAYNYIRSAAYCLNLKSAFGLDERKMHERIEIKEIDSVTESIMKFMFMQNEKIDFDEIEKQVIPKRKLLKDYDSLDSLLQAI